MAAKKKPTKKKPTNVEIPSLRMDHNSATFLLLGKTPLIMNKMSQKVLQGLLLPKGRKTAADRAATLKHYPLEEYRRSMYQMRDDKAPTLLGMPAVAFKRAMAQAALDLGGMKKAEVGRLSWCEGTEVCVYGVPQLLMSVVRSADKNRTPDIRTRAVLPSWACVIKMTFCEPKLNVKMIADLMATAGLVVGVGDWRQQKGSGNFGQFLLAEANDPEVKDLMAHCGRDAQVAAYDEPEMYDDESRELYDWWGEEAKRRGKLKAV